MSTTPPDEPARDEMLRTALRHAPDRDARPPDALSAQILRTAQQATARAKPATTPSPWARAGRTVAAWLRALMRPAPAAAFATLMLGTVIGVMWREGPPPDKLVNREQAVTSVHQRASSSKAAEASAAEAESASLASPAAVRQPAEADAAPPQPKRTTAPGERRAAAEPSRGVPSPSVGATSVKRYESSPTMPLGASSTRSDTAAPVPSPAAQAADDARRADGIASANRERRSEMPVAAAARTEAAPASVAPTPVARAARAAAVPADPLATLAQGWPGASEDQRAALDELRRLSAGRWSFVAAPANVPRTPAPAGSEGQPPGRLTITDDAVFWQPPGIDDHVWRAPLPTGAVEDLRRRLAPLPGR